MDDETASLSTRALLPGSTRLVLSQMPRELCLAEAAGRVADAYNVLHGGRFNEVARRGGAVLFRVDDRSFPFAVSDEAEIHGAMERTLLFIHALLCLLLPDAPAALRGVSLRRASGPATVPFGRLARLRYGASVYALRYDAGLADRIVSRPPTDRLTYEAAVRTQVEIVRAATVAGGPSATDQARRALWGGASRQDEVAAALGVSPATLRRRLAGDGTCFRELRAEVLTAQARPLLAGALDLSDVAARLGFADVRSFNRAFKAWTGQTPNEARQRGRL